jgi:hypothetical protein
MNTTQPFTRLDVSFTSGEDTCAAWLYLPTGVTSPPVVILGHGLGATREMRLDALIADSHKWVTAEGPHGAPSPRVKSEWLHDNSSDMGGFWWAGVNWGQGCPLRAGSNNRHAMIGRYEITPARSSTQRPWAVAITLIPVGSGEDLCSSNRLLAIRYSLRACLPTRDR